MYFFKEATEQAGWLQEAIVELAVEKKLKFEGKFEIGTYIRAYDFEPIHNREDMYVEGQVIGITEDRGYKAYVITCTVDMYEGNPNGDRVGVTIYVQMETIDDYDHRVFAI